ncbi:MAG: DEAD/DEAH box helicase family protein [Clostridiales bacterium]|nr:DEAD/DEAH box helicase family protein [Clostridiales bacterium]
MKYEELNKKYEQLLDENIRLKKLLKKNGIVYEEAISSSVKEQSSSESVINIKSTSQKKVELFKSLFVGRTNVVAKRWESNNGKTGYSPYCMNEWQSGVCEKPRVKCKVCKTKNFVGLNYKVIESHLKGNVTLGLYPLMEQDLCKLLVMDFDKKNWKEEVVQVVESCEELEIDYSIEISRSGNGAHLWFFFDKIIRASEARKFGFAILDYTMQKSDFITFNSYDRLFPSQDFVEKEGFGNLIALPLQKQPRSEGKSIFVNKELIPYDDQWEYLSSIKRINIEVVREMNLQFKEFESCNSDYREEKVHHWNIGDSDFTQPLKIIFDRGVTLFKDQMTSKALYKIRKLASYNNPEFFSMQAMRMSTYNISRVVENYQETKETITIPRGLIEDLKALLKEYKIQYKLIDERITGNEFNVEFKGELRLQQQIALDLLSQNDNGVLSATTGFGKTVVGASLIAEKKVPTLIIVHTKELALQWIERLETFLEMEMIENQKTKTGRKRKPIMIGQLGAGKNRLTGRVDIALMQSMMDKDKNIRELINDYGMVLVDECHHVPSISFSNVLFESKAKYVYGLTATPIRKDGHHPIIFMQCGPIRYRVDAKEMAQQRTFEHYLIPRFTNLRLPLDVNEKDLHISELYKNVCENKSRNKLIVKDIKDAVGEGRKPIVLSERTSHLMLLKELLEECHLTVIVLVGTMKNSDRKKALETLRNIEEEPFVLLATGKLIGEGFDEAKLDTLFLTMPISWKGIVAQYAGRLHREFDGKHDVRIYDYIDIHVLRLERMYHKRLSAYKSIGYSLLSSDESIDQEGIYSIEDYFELVLNDINQSSERIIIGSYQFDNKKLESIKSLIADKFNNGIKIILVTKRNKKSILLDELHAAGVVVIYSDVCHKFVSIDNKILWYGGIDPLGYSKENDHIIRVLSDSAEEIVGGKERLYIE